MSETLVHITPAARDKILEFMRQDGRSSLALRMAVAGRGPGGFQYRLGFVSADERAPEDSVQEAGGFDLYVDAESLPLLKGASVDFVEASYGSGFKIDNPNPLWTDPVALEVQKILDEEINPAVASHSGHVTLLDVKGDTAYIQLGGGCQGCGMADVTLKQGIEVRIKEAVPQIARVLDTTDHAAGANPYYRPSHRGHSPVGG
uniref:Iron-sulfur cluster assembly accessory protein n=1 Tax=Eiseniibacteriota bacterium TaxID=2212470 RepID=A0A832I9X7_UNCEI